jgi:GH24 family phage-related lysozyme (muramidase)
MSNIDWDFILEQEGFRLKGYVPNPEGSDSGVTIASGFDLGARSVSDLKGLSKEIIDLLTPYLGIKGAAADEVASNLVVSDDQAKTINEFAKKKELGFLKKRWKTKTGQSFDDLPMREATVITSVAFQYGNLATETPNFWRQVTSGDWDGAVGNLRNFGDAYGSRRNREADYFETGAQKKSEQFGIKTDPIRGIRAPDQVTGGAEFAEDYQIQREILQDSPEPKEVYGDAVVSAVPPSDTSRDEKVERLIEAAQPETVQEDRGEEVSEAELTPQPEEESSVEEVQTSMVEQDASVMEELATVELPSIEDDLADEAPLPNVVETLPESKANSLMPTQDDFIEGYTTLYGKPNTQYGQRIPSQLEDQDAYDYSVFDESFSSVWGAAFRQNNFFPALMRSIEASDPKFKKTSGYSVFNDKPFMKKIGGKSGAWRFRHSGSSAESNMLYDRMQEDAEDANLLSATRSVPATIASSLTSPTIFAPLAPIKVLKTANRTRRFVGGSAYTYALMAPEQMLIDSQNTQRDASHGALALTAMSLIGGSLAVTFGKGLRTGNIQEQKLLTGPADDIASEGDGTFRAAGAGVSPDRARQTAYADMEDEALEGTGIGVEKLPWNPVIRMMQSQNPIVRGLAVGMVDVGGMMQKKVRSKELEMDQSIETTFRTKYMSELAAAVRASDEAYLNYRGITPSTSDSRRAFQMIKEFASDKVSSSSYLTEVQFRNRIARAMRRGDVDRVGDDVSPFVTEATTQYRKLFNLIKNESEKAGLFQKELDEALEAAKRSGDTAAIRRVELKIQQFRSHGVTPNTAASYVPRIYRVDKIMAKQKEFLSIIETYATRTLRMNQSQARAFAKEVMDTVTRNRPYYDLEDATNLDWVSRASSAKARTLEIPDELIEEFLENDIEMLMKHHVKTMGMDAEIALKYGDVNMQAVIDDVTAEYKRLMDDASDANARADLSKKLEADLRDIRGLRDRLRGTYGASKDPHAMSSRFVRVMKSINVLVGMGGAMVSSIPDVARTVMVEGLSTTYEKGFRAMFDEQGRILKAMTRDELNKAAVGVDAVLGLRAHAFSDMGDLFGSRYTVERSLNQATGAFFLINGLNLWNQALKEFAGNVTMLRMTDSIMKPWSKISAADKEKLLKNGIGQQDHMRMQSLIKQHGEQINGQWVPNTDAWDPVMRLKFRNALNQNVERIIITPGAGDRALWTSTEFGSLLTQFKSYGQGAVVRMMTAGLQEKDGAFWQGAFLIVGLAAMVNEIKRIQYGKTEEETFNEKMANAIDRSGVLGWFMDVNNAVEKISDYKLGMRPFMTDQPQYRLPDSAIAGEVLGPTASNTMTLAKVLGDVVSFNADEQTLRESRFIMPGTTLPYLDPIYDGIFGQ